MNPIIKIMQEAAHKAGRSLLRDFGEVENLQVSQKGPGDFVSAADHKAEETIINELQKSRPNYSILSEEIGEVKGSDGEYRWIVDPLDGTMNFLHGVPQFCVSIGLEKTLANGNKDLIAGVIFVPISNEVYWAEKGQGAYVGNRRLQVSGRKRLDGLLVGTGGLGNHRDKSHNTKEAIIELENKGVNVRMMGSAALELAYVAAGKLDGLWHVDLKPWDMAAGIVIVREAKGMATEIDAGSNMLENGNILAANTDVHDDLQRLISSFYKS
jgi:myo-inositol-1(or 4)-monophosphatase